ncbi:MAG: 30S ribosomal protein S12 methylthiotransferase RimO [Eubacteriales bacterium]|nr:30S ribosomal protein S12 methylthiotransferase RimO [Eubacteriales bacterium]
MKIGTISLGCDKNRVDTEKMLARLLGRGHTFVDREDDADVIVVNTCAFIDSAKTESIDEILSAVEYKKKNGTKIVVTGCLPQRYKGDLKEALPEVDLFLGTGDYDMLCDYLDGLTVSENKLYCSLDKYCSKRVLTTPYHYAYLKIADGCDNHCTYCAIPSIRGKYRSEKIEDLVGEAKSLSDEGVKELILVAQDVTRYGTDLYGKKSLTVLLDELSKLDFYRIRLMYLEPEMVDDELIDYVANNEKIAKYMDVPFQHIDSRLLKLMGRHTDEEYTKNLVNKIKTKGIKIRSSFIVGFPSEGEKEFEELYDFIRDYEIDYAGFFEYSLEEGTPAEKLDGKVDDDVKAKRCESLRELQERIIMKAADGYVGKTINVLYEDIDYDNQMFVGRAEFQAPDIDNVVRFTSETPLNVGEIYSVEITGRIGMDLLGRVK